MDVNTNKDDGSVVIRLTEREVVALQMLIMQVENEVGNLLPQIKIEGSGTTAMREKVGAILMMEHILIDIVTGRFGDVLDAYRDFHQRDEN